MTEKHESVVVVGNDKTVKISHIDHAMLNLPKFSLIHKNIHHVPSLSKSILAISQFVHDNICSAEFSWASFFVKTLGGGGGCSTTHSSKQSHCLLILKWMHLIFTSTMHLWHSYLWHPSYYAKNKIPFLDIINKFGIYHD